MHLGVTTKTDVALLLGEPDLIWEPERIYVYEWSRRRAEVLIIGEYATYGYTLKSNEVLIVQFNERDRLARFDKMARPSNYEEYGIFLRNWARQNGAETKGDANHEPPP